MHRPIRLIIGATVFATVSVTALAGCSSQEQSTATGEPIKVAALSGLTFFPEAPEAVQAVFDDFNVNGGLDGRPIEYTVFDDKTDPAASATAAKDALDSGAIALVGSSSILDCSVNHKTWEDNGIVSLQGTGVDPYCFTTPNIAPANTGPYFDTFAALWNGSENLGFEKICAAIVADDAAGKSAYEQVISTWAKSTGQELASVDYSLTRGQASYAGNVAALKDEDCDAVFVAETGAAVTAFIGEAANQGLTLPFLVQTSAYSEEFAAGVSYGGDIHVPAELSPFTDPTDESNAEWAKVMDEHGVAKTSFAQGGYLAAKYFLAILGTIDGDITRESFTEAAKAMTEPIENPMAGTPWIFGPGDAHQANRSAWPLVIKANTSEWESVGPWIHGDEAGWVDITTPSS